MASNLLIKKQNKLLDQADLSPYTRAIQALSTMVNKTKFKQELELEMKNIPSELRFLVKMEIKRLAKPCIRSLDLRAMVNDECRLISHHGIKHYLNVNGILCFEKLVKRYDEYTFGVYEGVLEEAQKERELYLQNQAHKQKKKAQLTELSYENDKFIVPCQDLLSFPTRKQERLNYVVAIEVFFADNSSVHASTLDISVNGLRIKLKDHTKLSKIKTFDPLRIVFRGLDKHYGLSRESIEYQALSISGEKHNAKIHLYRDSQYNKNFNDFVRQLVKVNKHRYKVNLDNVEMALSSKIYEQSFANSTPTLAVFVSRDENDFYYASHASMNANNKQILDYWSDEKGKQLIGFMLNQTRIYQLLNSEKSHAQMTIYCFNHVKDEKVYFYSATNNELNKHQDLASTFLSYGARKASWRVFQVVCTDINPNESYSPSALPDGINKSIDAVNKANSPRLQANLKNITNMLSITDITNDSGIECYQKRPIYKHKIRLLKAFGHARNKPPLEVEICRHKQKDLRRQTRYTMRTPVVIKTNRQQITGVSEDVSISGIKIQLDEAFIQRAQSKVSVSFSKLQAITQAKELSSLQYRVVHINIDKQVVHLQALVDEEVSIAEQFFERLIESNLDKLTQVSSTEKVAGMNMAFRNLHSKNSPQFCAYIEKKQHGFLPAMASVNQIRAPWMDFLHHDNSLALVNLSCLYQDGKNGKGYINEALRSLKLDPKAIKTEIYIAAPNTDDVTINLCIAKWQSQIPNQRAKLSFIKKALSNGRFFAFCVTINKALKPDIEKLEQELLYMGQHAVHKASYFEERMWDIAGSIFLNDITSEVLHQYSLSNKIDSHH